jgi:indole-3-glycerol phosphate synthase
LTEEDYFQGSLNFINDVKAITRVPVLRKDFIMEPYQVYESRYFGADAILLIADILNQDEISALSSLAYSLGLACLVEVHTEKELKKILKLKDIPLIGVNNRSLHTLEVDPKTIEKLYTLIPKDKVVMVESGIKSYQDVLFLKILGVNAILVGTAFMQAADIRAAVNEIMGW